MKKSVFSIIALVGVVVCLSLIGCVDKKTSEENQSIDSLDVDSLSMSEEMQEDAYMPKAADELFDDFFFNFAANKKLQKSRIQTPLPCYKNKVLSSKITKDKWAMEQFFMKDGYYTLIFDQKEQMNVVKDTTVNHVVVEKIFLEKNNIKQYYFDRLKGEWMLTSINELPVDSSKNASFLNFYRRFSNDDEYQLQSINDLVTFSAPDPDDDFNTITGMMVPEQWPTFKPSLIPHGVIYNINYGQPYVKTNQKVFLIRGIANGLESEMIFQNKNGVWKLIKFMS